MNPVIRYPGIMYPVHAHMETGIDRTAANLKLFKEYYIPGKDVNILFKGTSGAILATLLYTELKLFLDPDTEVKMCQIRCKRVEEEDGESSHHDIEGLSPSESRETFYSSFNVIVDDFTSSGRTIRTILEEIVSHHVDLVLCAGAEWVMKLDKKRDFSRLKYVTP